MMMNIGTAVGDADTSAPIRNIMQSLPPLLSTIHEQTGITLPNWMVQMPNGHQTAQSKPQKDIKLDSKANLINGD
jgi:flotillin